MSDKDDIEYAISTVKDEVSDVESGIQELTNAVRMLDMGIGGSSGILDNQRQMNNHLSQVNNKLKIIIWLLGALLLVIFYKK